MLSIVARAPSQLGQAGVGRKVKNVILAEVEFRCGRSSCTVGSDTGGYGRPKAKAYRQTDFKSAHVPPVMSNGDRPGKILLQISLKLCFDIENFLLPRN